LQRTLSAQPVRREKVQNPISRSDIFYKSLTIGFRDLDILDTPWPMRISEGKKKEKTHSEIRSSGLSFISARTYTFQAPQVEMVAVWLTAGSEL